MLIGRRESKINKQADELFALRTRVAELEGTVSELTKQSEALREPAPALSESTETETEIQTAPDLSTCATETLAVIDKDARGSSDSPSTSSLVKADGFQGPQDVRQRDTEEPKSDLCIEVEALRKVPSISIT